MLRSIAAAGLAALALPAIAGEAGDLARQHLYAGSLSEGLTALVPFDERYDQEGRFGIGLIRFVQGVEHLAQGLYRHGFAAPDTGPMGPAVIVPVPPNPKPEPLDYGKLRGLLAALVNDMDAAKEALLDAGELGDYVVPIDVMRIRIDVDGDGRSNEAETIGGVLASMFGAPVPPAGQPSENAPQGVVPDVTIGFDRADAIWLAGYSQVVAAQADFLLAHDFHELVDVAFHRLFPRAGLPMQDYIRSDATVLLDPNSDNAIADLIAAVHTLNFPVVEPARLKRVLSRLEAVTALSRRNWEAILAETDDDRELVPSPSQTPLVPDAQVTDETVEAWLATLDTADQILRGELLVPHWRFQKGFDLRAYFENATRFDLVLLISGYDALPFLKDGPVANAESFAAANRVFGDAIWGYAFWFN